MGMTASWWLGCMVLAETWLSGQVHLPREQVIRAAASAILGL